MKGDQRQEANTLDAARGQNKRLQNNTYNAVAGPSLCWEYCGAFKGPSNVYSAAIWYLGLSTPSKARYRGGVLTVFAFSYFTKSSGSVVYSKQWRAHPPHIAIYLISPIRLFGPRLITFRIFTSPLLVPAFNVLW